MMTELKRWTNPRLALGTGFLSLVAAISVYGCAPVEVEEEEMDESSQGVVIPEVPVPPAVTINHVMVA